MTFTSLVMFVFFLVCRTKFTPYSWIGRPAVTQNGLSSLYVRMTTLITKRLTTPVLNIMYEFERKTSKFHLAIPSSRRHHRSSSAECVELFFCPKALRWRIYLLLFLASQTRARSPRPRRRAPVSCYRFALQQRNAFSVFFRTRCTRIATQRAVTSSLSPSSIVYTAAVWISLLLNEQVPWIGGRRRGLPGTTAPNQSIIIRILNGTPGFWWSAAAVSCLGAKLSLNVPMFCYSRRCNFHSRLAAIPVTGL